MSQTAAGRRVLEAADNGEIVLRFSHDVSPPRNLFGEVPITIRGEVPEAIVYLKNNQNGRLYDLLGIRASGYQTVAGTGTHEGLHALGIAGSRRAEALVRLAELEQLGVRIDARAIRQVLSDMRGAGNYGHLPWRNGGSTLGVDF